MNGLAAILPFRLRRRYEGWRHDRAIAGIVDTPPIEARDDGVVLFSMIGTAVLRPYLVAVKSLHRRLGRGRIVILDDGSLTSADRRLLAHHCDRPEIVPLANVDTHGFPRGGTWERLLTILDRRGGEYWIQLDSDTVTIGPVPEIAAAVDAGEGFILPGGEDAMIGILPAPEIARRLHPGGPEDGHIQTRIESRMGELAPTRLYARGCSGFAGFAPDGQGRPLAARIAGEMEGLVGPQAMAIWGTEQVASNFHLANEAGTRLLPALRYVNYWGLPWAPDAGFVHFLGPHRHDRGAYAAASKSAIADLTR